jgi:hypothetical protein
MITIDANVMTLNVIILFPFYFLLFPFYFLKETVPFS